MMCCDCRIFCWSSAIVFCVLPALVDWADSPTVNLAVSMLFKVSRSFLSWARCHAMALSLSIGMQTLLIRGRI
jgi:hypothetical protein